jgi:hypothetical protein
VPTNSDYQYVGPDSSILPTSIYGQAVWPEKQTNGDVLPTDQTGRIVYEIIHPDGKLLPTDSTGRYVDNRGKCLKVVSPGHPDEFL